MKELTRLVLASGLIDKHASKLLERWGCLDPAMSDAIGDEELATLNSKKKIREALRDFIEELELLIQPEAIERDTTSLNSKE